ncbi:MAG: hypothetical protein WCH34_08405 [Bacteroidota bacterium]
MAETMIIPESTQEIEEFLLAAQTKQDSIPPEDQFLSEEVANELEDLNTNFPLAVSTMETAEGVKINKVSMADSALNLLKKHGICILTNVNLHIYYGDYPTSVRPFFLMSKDSATFPKMTTKLSILNVSEHISTGIAALPGLGLPVPSEFTAAQNLGLRQSYITKSTAANTATENFNTEVSNVAQLRETFAVFYPKLRKELDFHCKDMNESAKRDYLRLWGVKYDTVSEGTEISILTKYADGGAVVPGVPIRCGQKDTKATKKVPTPAKKGVKGVTNAHGSLVLKTTQTGNLFLVCKHPECVELAYPIKVEKGKNISVTLHLVKLPPEV